MNIEQMVLLLLDNELSNYWVKKTGLKFNHIMRQQETAEWNNEIFVPLPFSVFAFF